MARTQTHMTLNTLNVLVRTHTKYLYMQAYIHANQTCVCTRVHGCVKLYYPDSVCMSAINHGVMHVMYHAGKHNKKKKVLCYLLNSATYIITTGS